MPLVSFPLEIIECESSDHTRKIRPREKVEQLGSLQGGSCRFGKKLSPPPPLVPQHLMAARKIRLRLINFESAPSPTIGRPLVLKIEVVSVRIDVVDREFSVAAAMALRAQTFGSAVTRKWTVALPQSAADRLQKQTIIARCG